MIEIPEAATLANQINKTVHRRAIIKVTAAHSPHKFVWYHGKPEKYHQVLKGKKITKAISRGGIIEIQAEDARIILTDGAGLRYHPYNTQPPKKHQLLLELDDFSFLSVSIQMYGGIMCFRGICKNRYYLMAHEKPSPLTKKFTQEYFMSLVSEEALQKKSVKFFLTTQQRIPGLGNGVLQDILFSAKIHPKVKVASLSNKDKLQLYKSIVIVLVDMTLKRGRNTEKDLFGNFGGYRTLLCRKTVGQPCLRCSTPIQKENYLGGSIYYCLKCQPIA